MTQFAANFNVLKNSFENVFLCIQSDDLQSSKKK